MYDSHVSERTRFRVLVYSDDRDTRSAVMTALGPRPHPELPPFEFVECATEPVLWQQLDDTRQRPDLVILDGESTPAGGLGVARQLKDEVFQAPPVLVLTGRPQDAWLATWSRADAAVSHPIDPLRLAEAVTGLARSVQQPG